MEPRASADASRMGDGAAHPREGRRKLRLVVVADALAKGQQQAGATALLGQHEGPARQGVQTEATTVRSRHYRQPGTRLPMLKLHSTSLRNGLKEVLKSVSEELVIASPYIKTSEAKWVCDELERRKSPSAVRLQVLTDVRSANVLSGSLDIEALNLFSARIPASVVVNLPRKSHTLWPGLQF